MRIICACIMTVFIASAAVIPAVSQDSYEDYRYQRDTYNRDYPYQRSDDGKTRRESPLSDVSVREKEDFLDDLRGAVRDEIDTSISKERKASTQKINENKLIRDVRRIVKEEIEDAIKIKEKRYLTGGTWELGGFVSAQFKGLSSSEEDNNFRFRIQPTVNYFIFENMALSLRGEADFNVTASSQIYNAGAGPMFVFGLDRKETICFYTTIFAGVSMNTTLQNQMGFRYGNEFGFKFILTSGVILNFGALVAFDNAGDSMEGFQNIIIPTMGVTAWF